MNSLLAPEVSFSVDLSQVFWQHQKKIERGMDSEFFQKLLLQSTESVSSVICRAPPGSFSTCVSITLIFKISVRLPK